MATDIMATSTTELTLFHSIRFRTFFARRSIISSSGKPISFTDDADTQIFLEAFEDGDHREHTIVGRLLFDLAEKYVPNTALEFFTSNAKGGSGMIATGLNDGARFITLEANPILHKSASQRLSSISNNTVPLLSKQLGSAVPASACKFAAPDLLYLDFGLAIDIFDVFKFCSPSLVMMTQVNFVYDDIWAPATLVYRAALLNPQYERIWYGPCKQLFDSEAIRDCALFAKIEVKIS